MAGPGVALTLLRRADALAHALLPAALLLVLMVLAALPLGLPGLVAAVSLPCVVFWSVFRPAALPPPAVFGFGLLQDLLTGAPLGASILVLLVAQGLALRWRGTLAGLSFLALWLAYAALAAAAALLAWALHSLLGWRLLPLGAAGYSAALTTGLWPWLASPLTRAHQGMRRADRPV